jgi:hypothetical protein
MFSNPTLACLAREFADRFDVPRIEASEVCAAAKKRGITVKDGRVLLRDSTDKADIYFQVGYDRGILEPPVDA